MLLPFLQISLLSVFKLSKQITNDEYAHNKFHSNSMPRISAERPNGLSIKMCTHKMEPFQLDTMLFFPNVLKFCAVLETSKGSGALIRDRKRTSYLRPIVSLILRQVGSFYRCKIDFMGYTGEYRFSPDFGYYTHCQRPIARHIDWLASVENKDTFLTANTTAQNPLQWDTTESSCPIQSLPHTSRELNICELSEGKWYELFYHASIQYKRPNANQFSWSNYSTTFVFKPERLVEVNGTELGWLERLIYLKVKVKNCAMIRYLIKLDDQWPATQLPIRVQLDYQVRENAYIKYIRHLANGTVDLWFTGTFPTWPTREIRTHELCVQFTWPRSANRYRLCRTFIQHKPTFDCDLISQLTTINNANNIHNHYLLLMILISSLTFIFCLNFSKFQ